MNRKEIDVFEYSPFILEQLKKGMLLNVRCQGMDNTMTIGWGAVGIIWGKKSFTVYVKDTRFTHSMLEKAESFIISSQLPGADPVQMGKILALCGSRSGKDTNKFELCHLDTVQGVSVDAPAIVQLPLTIECRILTSQNLDAQNLPENIKKTYYPSGGYHTAYYGEITAAYIIEE